MKSVANGSIRGKSTQTLVVAGFGFDESVGVLRE